MKKASKIVVAIVLSFAGSWSSVYAQNVVMAPFSLAPSNLIGELKKVKSTTPGIKPSEFVAAANSLLDTEGLNFVVAFDAATCQKIEQARKALKNPGDPLNLRSALRSVDGDTANLRLPEASFDKAECGSCFVSLPLLEATPKDFVIKVLGRNVKFHLPQNFVINEAALVEGDGMAVITTKWKIPFRTTPLTVSEDGDVLYLGFAEPELKDLALIVFSEGSFRFVDRKEVDLERKGFLIKNAPKDPNNSNLSFMKFENARAKHIVRFPTGCGDQTLK